MICSSRVNVIEGCARLTLRPIQMLTFRLAGSGVSMAAERSPSRRFNIGIAFIILGAVVGELHQGEGGLGISAARPTAIAGHVCRARTGADRPTPSNPVREEAGCLLGRRRTKDGA